MAVFKIATYNVNSIRSRLHIVVSWLEKNRPDVFCLQETKVNDDRFPAGEFEGIGYHVVFKGKTQYNGVAVASLVKPEEVSFGLDDGGPRDEDRLIRGVFSDIPVINAYVPRSVERGLGWRVDHILATSPLADRSLNCIIVMDARRAEKPSDHTILVAEFDKGEEGNE
ncbi:MAG: exodeoxyribonuclease III [Syntrophales bacterium]|nr:exodeoxyribonuclease III [Syntrophales bacterium]